MTDNNADVDASWAAVPFPYQADRQRRIRLNGRPVMIPAEAVEDHLRPAELATFVRLTLWKQQNEEYSVDRVANELWNGDLDVAFALIEQLRDHGLVVTPDQYRDEMEQVYPGLREQRIERENRTRIAAEREEHRRQMLEERERARAERLLADQSIANERDPHLYLPTEDDGTWAGQWPLPNVAARPPKGQPVVYVLYGANDRAVYVGSTDNFLARMKSHQAGGKRWSTWSALPCDTREEAFEVESEYLAEYMPQLNVQGPRLNRRGVES